MSSTSKSFICKLKKKLEEKMEDFLQNQVNVFHNGKYDNNIRAVYQDLLYMGLSIQNIHKVINIA